MAVHCKGKSQPSSEQSSMYFFAGKKNPVLSAFFASRTSFDKKGKNWQTYACSMTSAMCFMGLDNFFFDHDKTWLISVGELGGYLWKIDKKKICCNNIILFDMNISVNESKEREWNTWKSQNYLVVKDL